MNRLESEGFVLAGGPLEDNDDTLLIVRARNANEIGARLAADPWGEDMLPVVRIAPWKLRLGKNRLG